jgi:hypothetical protein
MGLNRGLFRVALALDGDAAGKAPFGGMPVLGVPSPRLHVKHVIDPQW